ncbi:MAG: DMT family transporter [Bdellovibrionaceae bacterium]|nr:DMT family transporter [Pseudobdellovibrionaceae bacterium]
MTRRQALGELIFAGVLWGFGFVATVWALTAFTPSELLAWRFVIAVVVAEVGRLLWRLLRGLPLDLKPDTGDLKRSIPAGILLATMLLPQTIGLQYTTASKSGFLTALYVIFVPLVAHFALGTRQKPRVYLYALLALAGAYLLMGADFSSLNPGDLWTILCALIAAFHILYIEKISMQIKDPFRFNTLQTAFCLIPVFPLLTLQPQIQWWTSDLLVWFGILSLAIGSTVIGFTIQLRTQRVLNSTTASMLFLLESPFSLLFGIILLKEPFGPFQAAGAVLILLAALQTVRSETTSSK